MSRAGHLGWARELQEQGCSMLRGTSKAQHHVQSAILGSRGVATFLFPWSSPFLCHSSLLMSKLA